jgi:hypothetical protein
MFWVVAPNPLARAVDSCACLSILPLLTWLAGAAGGARAKELEGLPPASLAGYQDFGSGEGNPMRECILLAASGANELLPQNPELPADVFTACLTTPIKARHPPSGFPALTLSTLSQCC